RASARIPLRHCRPAGRHAGIDVGAGRGARTGDHLHLSRARVAIRELHPAGQVRLRPIMMTTAAMIFGMLPLALGLGESGETQAPMGRAIIGGVLTSTLLTLVVVPVIYTYLDRLTEWRRARKVRHTARIASADAPAPGD